MVGVVMGDEDVMHILEAKSIVMEMLFNILIPTPTSISIESVSV